MRQRLEIRHLKHILKAQRSQENPRPSVRPRHYEGLLLYAINDDPTESSQFDEGWERQHATRRRFYVGGTLWFQNNAGLSASRVAEYREKAIERFDKLMNSGEIDWRKVPGLQADPQRYWREMSRQQFNVAFGGKPIYLSKAMYVLMTCEVAVEDLIQNGIELPNIIEPYIKSPQDIYAAMSIVPACWNIDNLNLHSLGEAIESDGELAAKLAMAAGQPRGGEDMIRELAAGSTVTHATAKAIVDYLQQHAIDLQGVPRVRATSGRYLGTRDAAIHESVDLE